MGQNGNFLAGGQYGEFSYKTRNWFSWRNKTWENTVFDSGEPLSFHMMEKALLVDQYICQNTHKTLHRNYIENQNRSRLQLKAVKPRNQRRKHIKA